MNALIGQIERLSRILQLPGAIQYRVADPAFRLPLFELCHRLKCSGVTPASIYDVGANVGQFALASKWCWPGAAILSYEPAPSTFPKLQALAAKHPEIHCFQLGLSKETGELPFYISDYSESNSLRKVHQNHLEAYPEVTFSGCIQVAVTTLADVLTHSPARPPSLLKLDVQGCEADVLIGAGNHLRDFNWIVLETSTMPMYEGEACFGAVSDLLSSLGFHFKSPATIHCGKHGELTQFDALFERSA